MRARPLVLSAAGLATALMLTACGSTAHSDNASPAHSGSQTSAASSTAASSSPAAAAEAASAADVAFAQLMIPHHKQAVAMAELALQRATTKPVKDLATQIKAAQGPEIAQLQSWLTAWGAPLEMEGAASSSVGGHDMGAMDMSGHDMGGVTMAGMMNDEDMKTLATVKGNDFDRMWLGMMIVHHEGAVEMAKQVRTATDNLDVQQLADAIITGQTAEIATMNRLVGA